VPPRVFVETPIAAPGVLELPGGAARHVQVLRLQPGAALTLFDGRGGEWAARIVSMGRREVHVQTLHHDPIERELPHAVTVALAMPAGDRMDFVVEKATELGAAAIQPLVSARSVLRLSGARAAKRVAHWQAIAVAACEQCGRNRVPALHEVRELADWLGGLPVSTRGDHRVLLGWNDAIAWPADPPGAAPGSTLVLSGPEGGLQPDEESAARARGFVTVSLGPRVLRADTAPLAALAILGAMQLDR
jgi:16S rRNA (uracil1498-N3)-methyltransferase